MRAGSPGRVDIPGVNIHVLGVDGIGTRVGVYIRGNELLGVRIDVLVDQVNVHLRRISPSVVVNILGIVKTGITAKRTNDTEFHFTVIESPWGVF